MPSNEPPEPETESRRDSVSEDASDWIRQFLKYVELHFLDASLPCDARVAEYQDATIRAVIQTLLDSGMTRESVLEALGCAATQQGVDGGKWDSKLNQRRFTLIDKEIQGVLTPAESIELAGLTRIMREHVESETNLPMEGTKELHRKLLEWKATDESN